MVFFLNPNITYALDPNLEPLPEPDDVTDTDELKAGRKKRAEDEVMCRGHILNTLSDRLYDFYNSMETPKKIWTELEYKYKSEKEVGAIITKLHPRWNDYKKKLLHRRDDIFLEELQKHLRIKEETRSRDQKNVPYDSSKVNIIEGMIASSEKNGFWKKEDNNSNTANVVENPNEELVAMVSEMHIDMLTELNMAQAKFSYWWLHSGATIYVCNEKSMFSAYEEMKNDEVVLMRNHISAKKLTLKNVFHVPEIRKNLVSANFLCKNSFKIVLELHNCILTKNRSLDPDFISFQALTFLVERDRNSVLNKIPISLNIEENPKTFSEAILSRDAYFWREAINDEMDSIMSN
ncbi:hypothetical protein UlMin_045964 [Ulmus minor]